MGDPAGLPVVGAPPLAVSVAAKARVLHVITRLIRGGADENTILTANQLAAAGYHCAVACGGESDPLQMERVQGAEVYLIRPLIRSISPWQDAVALRELLALIRRFRPDIVHTHTAKAGVLGRVAARLAKVPIVIHGLHGTTFHSYQPWLVNRTLVQVERALAALTTAYLSVSLDLCQLYVKNGIGRGDQYATVRSGMDLAPFYEVADWGPEAIRTKRRELGVPEDRPLIVTICRLESRKRVNRFVEAAAALRDRGADCYFAIAGEGPSERDLRRQVADLGLEGRVRFLGFRDDVAEVIAASSVVCLTSAWEGLPRVFVQALAVGRMVVCFEVEGAREVITQGVTGWVVPADDPGQLGDRLAQVIGGLPEGGVPAPSRGNSRVASWSIENMVADTAMCYDYLLRGRPVSEARPVLATWELV